ncbi:ATP-binding cassette domain-containing protein [Streptomyces sp. NPDC055058]
MSIAQYALHDITKHYDDHVVLDRVGFSVRPGEKVGVIGDNGSGKSTLLKVLAGRERPDNGTVTVAAPGGIGYLAQTLELPLDATVQDAVDLALSDLREPVGQATAAGAVGGAGATAGVAVGGTAALTVAAPLVLMAVAVGVSAHADGKRQQAIEHITELLEQLHEQKLVEEHSELDGCRDAIDKATAILLDQGRPGVSLGLDSAVHAINSALGAADRRLAQWQNALDKLPADKSVDLGTLTKSFPGIDDDGGIFRAHLELAGLAIALKRRVIVLQAVEHAHSDPGNLFENFTRTLKRDQKRLDELESGIAGVLIRLSTLELGRTGGRRPVLTSVEVDRLMRAAHRIRHLGDSVVTHDRPTDVAIEIVREEDGSVIVFPALPASA